MGNHVGGRPLCGRRRLRYGGGGRLTKEQWPLCQPCLGGSCPSSLRLKARQLRPLTCVLGGFEATVPVLELGTSVSVSGESACGR